MFYKGGPIDNFTHIPRTFDQSSAEIESNSSCTARIFLSHFRKLNNEFLNKDSYVVPEQAPLIIFDRK